MILFKLFQEFLLPSVFIFILILLGLILILNPVRKGGALDPIALSNGVKRKKLGKIFIVIGLALYYIFSISPTADLILKPLENKYQPIKQEDFLKADKIVLLLGNKENSNLRANEAMRLYFLKNQTPEIIITGAAIFNPEKNPARDLKDYLTERGILPENIILEGKSRNTFESAKNIKELLDDEPFFLITSAYHLPRSMEVFQKMGTNPIPAPTDFKIKKEYTVLGFFPDGQNLRNSDLAFHEYFGILFYRIWHY